MSQPTLADRYGAPSPVRRRLVIVLSALGGLVFLVWLGWSALAQADPEVSSDLVTYTIDGENAATARVDVRVDGDYVVATCILRAHAEDHTVVGELSFEVTAADLASGSTLQRTVRTERLATSVELVGCTAPGQSRPQ